MEAGDYGDPVNLHPSAPGLGGSFPAEESVAVPKPALGNVVRNSWIFARGLLRSYLAGDQARSIAVHQGKMPLRITHDRIMQLATGFWASKAFLSAVELGVFGALPDGPLKLPELRMRLGLHERSARDFFDARVALELLRRDETGRYSNTEEAELLLNPTEPGYMGGLIEMLNARLYGFWALSPRLCAPANPKTRQNVAVILRHALCGS